LKVKLFFFFFFLQLFKIYHFKDDVDDSNNESTTPGTECNNCESIDKENIDSCNANDTLEMSMDDSSLTAVNDNSSDNFSILYQRIPNVMENGIDKKISKSRSYLEAATICREEAKRFIDENDFGLARSHCLKAFDILKDIHVDDDIADSEKMMGYQDCCSFFRKVSLLLYILSYHILTSICLFPVTTLAKCVLSITLSSLQDKNDVISNFFLYKCCKYKYHGLASS
jgi:hypothetical protein